MKEITIGAVYRHFKGNYYYVVDIAKHSETDEEMVVYKQLYPPYQTFVRPAYLFLQVIPERPDNITGQKTRFEKVKEIEKNYLI